MKIKTLLCVLAFSCLHGAAQEAIINPLKIGDPVPDITFTNLYNYPAKTAKLSDFKGKLVILDFWATWCGSCIKAFPKMEAVQQQYKDKLQVLLINSDPDDTPEKVTTFLQKRQQQTAKPLTLTYALQNEKIKKYFPHHSIPHMVWIGTDGRLLKITEASYITPEYIAKAINGTAFDALLKEDLKGVNSRLPLSIGQNKEIEQQVLLRSAFYPHLGLGSSSAMIRDSAARTITKRFINLTILELYQKALPVLRAGFLRNVVLDVKDDSRLLQKDQQRAEWRKANTYCYEITATDSTSDKKVKEWMLEDLNRFLGLNARIEHRRSKVWVLYLTDKRLIQSKGGPLLDTLDAERGRLTIQNRPWQRVVFFLNTYVKNDPMVPIIDATGMAGSVDMAIAVREQASLEQMQAALRPFGIDIRPEERDLDMVVISDK